MMMNSNLVKPPVLISACLLGNKCRYNGKSYDLPAFVDSLRPFFVIPVCPEILGGLPIPRAPSEINKGAGDDVWEGKALVIAKNGADFTSEFKAGALKTLELSRTHGAIIAIFKENSPSCGCTRIYDGSFSGRLVPGQGVTVSLLEKNGIKVISEKNWLLARGDEFVQKI